MIQINRVGDNITGSVNMKTFGVPFTEERWKAMSELKKSGDEAASMPELKSIVEKFEMLTKVDYSEVIKTASDDLYFNAAKGTFHLKLGKNHSKMFIPQPIVDRILKGVEDKIDVTPLVKFCIRYMRPTKGRVISQEKFERIANYVNYQSVDGVFRDELIKTEGISQEVATERATVFQTPITMEGLLCTYKVSEELLTKFKLDADGKKVQIPRYGLTIDEDTGETTKAIPTEVEDRVFYPAVQGLDGGDAFWCDQFGTKKLGHLIRVGATHYLDSWDQVNQNDDVSCVKGLHVGNLNYIRNYQKGTRVTHNIFVSPEDIGAITDDGSGALRVFRYFVHSSKAGENRGIYHSSVYGAELDAEWAIMKAEIEADLKAKGELIAQELASDKQLLSDLT